MATPARPGSQPHVQKARHSTACSYCKVKKIRCDGQKPCGNCSERNEVCIAPVKKPRWKRTDGSALAEKVAWLQSVLRTVQQQPIPTLEGFLSEEAHLSGHVVPNPGYHTQTSPPKAPDQDRGPESPTETQGNFTQLPSAKFMTTESWIKPDGVIQAADVEQWSVNNILAEPLPQSTAHESTNSVNDCGVMQQEHLLESPAQSLSQTNADTIVQERTPDEKQEGNSVYSGETSNYEYHGPRSFLSICSKPGILWVAEKTGGPVYHELAHDFVRAITRRLKIENETRQTGAKLEEPDAETAWRYANTFFQESHEAALRMIHQPWFNRRLQAYFAGGCDDKDPAWYALRNMVYAIGCRIVMSKEADFTQTNRHVWRYFENALSVHTQLIYFRTSIVSVQALALMTSFTGCLGTTCLEYMLCSNAVRLAYAKGLHRQPVSSWNLSPEENSHRNWLFWGIYCVEKQIASWSGRPSLIHDEDINCRLPEDSVDGTPINTPYCQAFIKMAQLSSGICKRLSSVHAFRQAPEALLTSIDELNAQMVAFTQSLSGILQLDRPLEPSAVHSSLTLQQAMYIYTTYSGLVLDINSVIVLPWSQVALVGMPTESFREKVEESKQLVLKTCRNLILSLKHINITATTPVTVAFSAPIFALVTLFVHILQNPTLPTADTDLTLMDIGTGHFSLLDYATQSQMRFVFAREIAKLARSAVQQAISKPRCTTETLQNDGMSIPDLVRSSSAQLPSKTSGLDTYFDFEKLCQENFDDIELEHFTTWLPTGILDETNVATNRMMGI